MQLTDGVPVPAGSTTNILVATAGFRVVPAVTVHRSMTGGAGGGVDGNVVVVLAGRLAVDPTTTERPETRGTGRAHAVPSAPTNNTVTSTVSRRTPLDLARTWTNMAADHCAGRS
jgi:hypothetical protein